MRQHQYPRASALRGLQCGQAGAQPGVIGDAAIFERYVEVLANQHPLARKR